MDCFGTLLTRIMANSGYHWTLRRDMGAWVEEMRGFPDIAAVNPAYDPAFSDTEGAMWLRVTHNGQVVAIIANKFLEYYEDTDYIDDLQWGRVWWREPLKWAPVPFEVQPVPMKLKGLIGHHGGLYVHPSHRKQGLSWALPRLVRAITFDHPLCDLHCGYVLQHLAESGLPLTAYGYRHMWPCFSADYFPVTRGPAKLHVTAITRAEMRDQLSADAEWLEAGKDQQLAGLVRDYPSEVAARLASG